MNKLQRYLMIVFMICMTWQPVFAQEQPSSQECFSNGIALGNNGLYEEAIKMYTNAIDLNYEYAAAYLQRGQAYRITKPTEPGFAMQDFDRAIAIDRTQAEGYYQRGLLNAFLINNEDAREDMQTAARLGHKGAREWLAVSQLKIDPVAAMEQEAQEDAGKEGAVAKETRPDLQDYLPSKSDPMIYFDFDKSDIKKNFHAMIKEVAGVLKDTLADSKIMVSGYTDSKGTEAYNEKLSLERAAAVKSYLESQHGILPERIITRAYGMNHPVDSNETEQGRAKNRRAQIEIAD